MNSLVLSDVQQNVAKGAGNRMGQDCSGSAGQGQSLVVSSFVNRFKKNDFIKFISAHVSNSFNSYSMLNLKTAFI